MQTLIATSLTIFQLAIVNTASLVTRSNIALYMTVNIFENNGKISFVIKSFIAIETEVKNPCSPTPCGFNSQCREINNQAVCSCLPEYLGSPPGCRPECTISSECARDKACVNQKCTDPCPGVCGLNTHCHVINHNPICTCQLSFTGDPFTRCYPTPPRKICCFQLVYNEIVQFNIFSS